MLKTILTSTVAIALCAALSGCSTRESSTAQSTELSTLSNKLAEASSKLAQREAAFETVRIKSELQTEEVRALTNRVVALRSELANTIEAQRKLQESIQQMGAALDLAQTRVKAAEEARLGAEQSLATCRAHANTLAGSLESAQTELRLAASRVNVLEADRAALLKQWNDSAQLRAQLKNIKRPAQGVSRVMFPSDRQKYAANPDGTISVTPSGNAVD